MAEFGKDAGQRLRTARERLGMSQFDAAVKLGVTDKTLGKWERGQATPRTRQWVKIEEVYSVTIDEIRGVPEADQLEQLKVELAGQSQMIELLLEAIRPGWRELLRPPGALAPPDEVGPNNGSSHDEAQND